jgi:hypothetical protein
MLMASVPPAVLYKEAPRTVSTELRLVASNLCLLSTQKKYFYIP